MATVVKGLEMFTQDVAVLWTKYHSLPSMVCRTCDLLIHTFVCCVRIFVACAERYRQVLQPGPSLGTGSTNVRSAWSMLI